MLVSEESEGVKYISTQNHSLDDSNIKHHHPRSKATFKLIKDLLTSGVRPRRIFNKFKGKTEVPISFRYINNIKHRLKSKGILHKNKLKHQNGLRIPLSNVVEVTPDCWQISSSPDSNSKHLVFQKFQKCPYSDHCFYRCYHSICEGLCSHLYQCSCSKQETLCEHIHRVRSIIRLKELKMLLNGEAFESCHKTIGPKCDGVNGRGDDPYNTVSPAEEPAEENDYSINSHESEDNELTAGTVIEDQTYDNVIEVRDEHIIIDQCDVNPFHSQEEQELRAIGQQLISNLLPAYFGANANILPHINSVLKNLLDLCTSSKVKSENQIIIRTFSPSLDNLEDTKYLTSPMFTVNSISINMLCLKSLDYGISNEEIMLLRCVDPAFNRGWVYDNVIDAFFSRLLENHKNHSFIYSAVSQLFLSSSSSISPLSGDLESIFIPYNLNGCHWILYNVKIDEKQICIYDPSTSRLSYGASGKVLINNLLKHLKESFTTLNEDSFKEKDWIVTYPNHCKQKDDFNCGVFICWYCERILGHLNLTDEFDPLCYREKIYSTILKDFPISKWKEVLKDKGNDKNC